MQCRAVVPQLESLHTSHSQRSTQLCIHWLARWITRTPMHPRAHKGVDTAQLSPAIECVQLDGLIYLMLVLLPCLLGCCSAATRCPCCSTIASWFVDRASRSLLAEELLQPQAPLVSKLHIPCSNLINAYGCPVQRMRSLLLPATSRWASFQSVSRDRNSLIYYATGSLAPASVTECSVRQIGQVFGWLCRCVPW